MRTIESLRLAIATACVTLCFSVCALAYAQDDARVTARLSAGVLRLGDSGSVNVTVENSENARIVQVPTVAGLNLGKPGRANSQQSTSFVNGRVYSEITIT